MGHVRLLHENLPVRFDTLTSAKSNGDDSSSAARFDFEARSPWYLYNQSSEGTPGADQDAETVHVFRQELMQASTRIVKATIDRTSLPSSWEFAALRLHLQKPPGKLE